MQNCPVLPWVYGLLQSHCFLDSWTSHQTTILKAVHEQSWQPNACCLARLWHSAALPADLLPELLGVGLELLPAAPLPLSSDLA